MYGKMKVEFKNGLATVTWDDGKEQETKYILSDLGKLFIGLTLKREDFKAAIFGYFFMKKSLSEIYDFLFECDAEGVCIRDFGYTEPYYEEDDPSWAA